MTMDTKKRMTAAGSVLSLLGACTIMVVGVVLLTAMGYRADAVAGSSLETWEYLVPWVVFVAGSLLTLWVLSVRGRNGQMWAWAAAILLSVPTLFGLLMLGVALFAP